MSDLIYFGEQGLSLTSANYIANLCKEAIQNIKLDNISFLNKKAVLLDSSANPAILSFGLTEKDLNSFATILQETSEMQSLIAWLREALKAKEKIKEEIENFSLEDFAELQGIEIPRYPKKDPELTEQEYYNSLSVKERSRYYELETKCAVLGKFIHPKGGFNNARKELNKRIKTPKEIQGSGKDMVIFSYEPSVDASLVEEKFFELQNKYREYQASLNGIKHACELAIQKSRDESNTKYSKEYEEYKLAYESISAKYTKYLDEKLNEVRDLKIIIPNDLKSIYEKVSALGKK